MNKKNVSKLNMFLAVLKTLGAYLGLINSFARLKKEVDLFKSKTDAIININTKLTEGTAGVTNTVSDIETRMIDAVVKLGRGSLTWAKDNNKIDLIEVFDVVKSDLSLITDAHCYSKSDLILSKVEANATELIDYNIVKKQIDDARLLVDEYKNKIGSIQSAVKTNKSSNKELKGLFKDADASLQKIMDLVLNNLADEKFSNDLIASKVINDAAVRSTGVNIMVTDADTDEPITNSWIYLEGTDKKDDADKDGMCELYKLSPERNVFRIEAPNYITEKIEANLEQGKIITLEVELKKAKA